MTITIIKCYKLHKATLNFCLSPLIRMDYVQKCGFLKKKLWWKIRKVYLSEKLYYSENVWLKISLKKIEFQEIIKS